MHPEWKRHQQRVNKYKAETSGDEIDSIVNEAEERMANMSEEKPHQVQMTQEEYQLHRTQMDGLNGLKKLKTIKLTDDEREMLTELQAALENGNVEDEVLRFLLRKNNQLLQEESRISKDAQKIQLELFQQLNKMTEELVKITGAREQCVKDIFETYQGKLEP